MRNVNLDNVQEATEFKTLIPGGYIAGIVKVEDVTDKEYLEVDFDIIEGEYKGFYKELHKQFTTWWGGKIYRSYKEKALPFFKSFITAVENSNAGFKFDYDENKLKGKKIGIVLGEEEYRANDGTVKTRISVDSVRSVDSIKKGDYKVPELKRLAGDNSGGFTASNNDNVTLEVSDDDYPF